MRKVTFNSVKIQNFLSIGKDPVEIDFQSGINLITGENKDKGGKNGVGKSSVINSVYWCLFGNTLNELKKDKILHNLNPKDCKVTLTFQVETTNTNKNYKIVRSIEPSKIQILCDDEDVTLSTIPENDNFIKEIIGGSEEVFQNAVIMSANSSTPFLNQKKTDKRKFIEGILNLNIFSDILLKARSDFNDTKKENDLLSNAFITLQRNLSTFEDQKANANARIEEKVTSLKNKYKEYEKERETLIESNKDNPTIEECNEQINDLETNKLNFLKSYLKTFKKTKDELVERFSNLSAEIKQLEKEKQKIIDKGNTCPTCNREYCEDDIKAVQQRIKEIDTQITILCKESSKIGTDKIDIDDKIEEVEGGIIKINNKIRVLEKTKADVKLHMQKLSNIATLSQDCLRLIDEVKQGDPSIDTNIQKTNKEILKTEEKLKNTKKKLLILESVKFVASEEGIKTYLVKKMLNVLNTKLNYYLQRLNTPCKITFNELFEEEIINENGKETSYFNYSGGERGRINTAILLMFQDLLRSQSGTSYNINVYDELLDSGVDSNGINNILEILRDKVTKYNESIYLVSHKGIDSSNIDNTILLEKINGVTRIAG